MKSRHGFHRNGAAVAGICLILIAILVWMRPAGAEPASGEAAREDQVRAALVYRFAQFVQWPGGGEASAVPVVIGILGDGRFRPVLEQVVAGKGLGRRQFEIRVYGRPEEVRDCDILVFEQAGSRVGPALDIIPKRGVLTIGNGEAFARAGGVIAIVLEGGRVKFDLNLMAAERAGLKINATLLGLARAVGRWPE